MATKKKATRKKVAKKKTAPRVTLASVAAQIATLTEAVAELSAQIREFAPTRERTKAAVDPSRFEPDLLATLRDLDRRGRHSGLVPIPEVRAAFLDRGWTRTAFDESLLQAERDFVVDLKVADDPARLREPALAIVEQGRGHLQYAVIR